MISKKNIQLLLGIGLLLLASYYLAINKTLILKKESDKLQSQSEQFNNIPKRLNILKQKNIYFDSILNHLDFNDTSIQNSLIRLINQEAKKNQVKVMDFNQPHLFQIGETNEYTYSFDLSGNFVDILKVANEIELKGNFGEIIHLNFEKKKDYKTSKSYLTTSILMQQVK
tara:strand:- start:3283 stop:3792 length:510 start_codon:yes stop_codon:yes gene_type:complete